jgi:hypothetical protein
MIESSLGGTPELDVAIREERFPSVLESPRRDVDILQLTRNSCKASAVRVQTNLGERTAIFTLSIFSNTFRIKQTSTASTASVFVTRHITSSGVVNGTFSVNMACPALH